jgi:phage shock protein C
LVCISVYKKYVLCKKTKKGVTLSTNRFSLPWARSDKGVVGGVFQGLSESYGFDPVVMRLIWAISVFLFGSGLLLYLFLVIFLPKRSEYSQYTRPKVLGVCYEISRQKGIDLAIVRIITLASFFFSFGSALIAYILVWVFMPKAPEYIEQC